MFLNLNHNSFDSSPLAEGSIGGCGYASPKTVADFGIFSGDCVILQANRNKWVLQVLKDTIHVPLSPTSVDLGTEPRPEPLPCRCAVQLYSWSLSQASDLLSPEEATSLRDGVVYGQFHVIHTHPSWLPLQLSLSSYLSELCIHDVKSETCARGHKLQLLTLVSCSCDTSAVRSAVFEALGRPPHVSVRPIMVCQMP